MLTRIVLLTRVLVVFLATIPSAVRLESKASTSAPNYARVHHSISSRNATVQKSFDRGLTLLYAFNRTAARRAFYTAAAADHRFAMAYWGIAMSYGSNINFPQDLESEHAAYSAIRKALALRATASPSERDYIEATTTRFSGAAKPDYHALAVAYHNAMRALAHKYPQDPDAATLYARAAWTCAPGIFTFPTVHRALEQQRSAPPLNRCSVTLLNTSAPIIFTSTQLRRRSIQSVRCNQRAGSRQ
jgi:hypothetical protein